jgi:hypothetical protein
MDRDLRGKEAIRVKLDSYGCMITWHCTTCNESLSEEEDTCHMRRRIHVIMRGTALPVMKVYQRRRIHVI